MEWNGTSLAQRIPRVVGCWYAVDCQCLEGNNTTNVGGY